MNELNIQWHSGFVAAMNLELAAYRNVLTFEKEYNLNTKPLEVDLLIIKKNKDTRIKNEIGQFFRRYNLTEYKSPEDDLNIDTFYKSAAYAALYKSYGEAVDSRKADDITISIIRESKPYGLFRYFTNHGIELSNPCRGIYYVQNSVLFPTQIIVVKELDKTNHTWLTSLSARLKTQDLKNLLQKIDALKTPFDKELADSVLEVSVKANSKIVYEIKGDDHMCQALLEIMEPEINKIKESVAESVTKSVTESVTESVTASKITSAVKSFHDFGINDALIKEALIKNFNLSPQEADAYL